MTEQELYEYAVTLLSKRDYSSGDLKYDLSRLSDDHQVDACGYGKVAFSPLCR